MDDVIEAKLVRVAELGVVVAVRRGESQAAVVERTVLVGELRALGVPLARIARRAGVTRAALRWRANAVGDGT